MHTSTYSPPSHTPEGVPRAGTLPLSHAAFLRTLDPAALRENARIWHDTARQVAAKGDPALAEQMEAIAILCEEIASRRAAGPEPLEDPAGDPAGGDESVLCDHDPSCVAVGG